MVGSMVHTFFIGQILSAINTTPQKPEARPLTLQKTFYPFQKV